MSGAPPTPTERVLAVPRSALFADRPSWPQGFLPLAPAHFTAAVTALEQHGALLDRAHAEDDPGHKQPIPYCVVRDADAVFVVQRLTRQGERRLHGRASLGIGGHVGPEDDPGPGCIGRALHRELHEELVLPADLPAARPLGLLNDDSTPVGSVHLGVVFELDLNGRGVSRDQIKVREISKMAGGFRPLAGAPAIWHDTPDLETWSALLLDAIQAQRTAWGVPTREDPAPRPGQRNPETR